MIDIWNGRENCSSYNYEDMCVVSYNQLCNITRASEYQWIDIDKMENELNSFKLISIYQFNII